MKKIVFTIFLGFAVIPSICAQTWSKLDKDTFIEVCSEEATTIFTAEGAYIYCTCTMEKAMVLYPNPDKVDLMTDKEAGVIGMECLLVMLEEEKDYFLGWTSEFKAEFISGCKEELIGSGLDSKTYCECALEETMRLYNNPYKTAFLTDEENERIAEKCFGL